MKSLLWVDLTPPVVGYPCFGVTAVENQAICEENRSHVEPVLISN